MEHNPKILQLLRKVSCIDLFAPTAWNGLKIEPVKLETIGVLPTRLSPQARPVRSELFENAKKEFDRLLRYFYELSTSAIASPLVIAAKATAPFLRFCGDYRVVNKYIKIPQTPIPIPVHELQKAAKFHIFIDIDMANSFHQIPLSSEFSDLLSVKTPWGLVRPKFLPEGVGPASGLLQDIVRTIFHDFEDWTVVIFDNFLICADDYDDAYVKLEKVIERCSEFGVVLKLKKSWFGVKEVNFFGYVVTHGKWRMSDERKAAISDMVFPVTTKQMQSFLGAALFFHHHIPDYSEWTSRLYEMTHIGFAWDPGKWTYDYKAHFDKFKAHITKAVELYFPDYSLPWIVRCDASEHAVGAVLYQEFTGPDSVIVHQPIAFASKRFSAPATKWDTFKREAYAIYHAVSSFHFFLRGKSFVVESDHRNLQWIETSQSPIVIRWRSLLQSYDFLIRHIPGKENTVADWMSRMYSITDLDSSTVQPGSFEEIMQAVHGGKHLHFGAYETWRRAKALFPDAHISLTQVQTWVKECAMCQKMRNTGIEGLPSTTRTLKSLSYRRTLGIDCVTVTPEDKHGNSSAVLVTEHFSHFTQVYPVPDASADSIVRVLVKHYSTFGLFDELASDPGSNLMADVVSKLNDMFGIRHKVSLVGRHESNGCEGSIKQFLRHLRTYVFDSRLVERWSDSNIISLMNFSLNSRETPETGGYTPFQLKFGTQDAAYFRLPLELPLEARPHAILNQLDLDLKAIRELSIKAQAELVAERKSDDTAPSHYELGDLVLWNPRERPTDFLPAKLSPTWLGPYEVVKQVNNSVSCVHIIMRTPKVFHMDRLKPFIGSRAAALELAKLDHNQYDIKSINYFTGNPHIRTSMKFNVTFALGDDVEVLDLDYTDDLAQSQQFQEFVNSCPYLFPVRGLQRDTRRSIINMRKLAITTININTPIHLDLRYFDSEKNAWFDALKLPDQHKRYLVRVNPLRLSPNKRTMELHCPTLQRDIKLTAYDVFALTSSIATFDEHTMVLITTASPQFPHIFRSL